MIEMQVVGVQEVLPTNTPVVLLRESEGRRLLPIFIGHPEATAIALALAGQETPRPMTHDLLVEVLEDFSIRVEQVVVSELRDRTFFAELHLSGPDGPQVVSARPSDAPRRCSTRPPICRPPRRSRWAPRSRSRSSVNFSSRSVPRTSSGNSPGTGSRSKASKQVIDAARASSYPVGVTAV